MGLVSKLKDMFTEEVVEEEPIKKEVMQVEIKAPEKKEEIEEDKVKKEDKFVFPVYFDDKDFETIEKKREKEKPKEEEKPILYNQTKDDYKPKGYNNEANKVKKSFEPTPIISPVYGILDKNYHKEDITTKRYEEKFVRPQATSIEEVRKKAYGTLEDEIDTNLMDNSLFFNNKKDDLDLFEEIDDEIDIKDKLDLTDDSSEVVEGIGLGLQQEPIIEIKQESKELDDKLDDKKEDSVEGDLIDIMNEDKSEDDDLTESDLLNLVDMMYEKRDDE